MDSSSVITPDGLVKEKGFVKALARAFQVPILNSRMAVLLYGSVPMPSKGLIVYKSFNDFDNDVDSLKAVSGDRRMDLALKTAENLLQREESRTRNIVILLTTGRQASGYRDQQLADSGKAARGVGAEVFVVTIGSEQNLEELRSVVADFQNIYQVGSLDYLKREALPIGRDIIGGKSGKYFIFRIFLQEKTLGKKLPFISNLINAIVVFRYISNEGSIDLFAC